jgi:hypothetical protein
MYRGGQSPNGRVGTKILQAPRYGNATDANGPGRRLDSGRSFSEIWSPISGNKRFASIVDVPTAGCWHLTLSAGKATAQVTVVV